MVIIFSEKGSALGERFADILIKNGAFYVSQEKITANSGFTAINASQKTEISGNSGAALFLDGSDRLYGQELPQGFVGICADSDLDALSILKSNRVQVITCGTGGMNTVTVSSITDNSMLISLQRSIVNLYGEQISPAEYPLHLTAPYSPFCAMAATTTLLLHGITPKQL